MRFNHLSLKREKSYIYYIKDFILFHLIAEIWGVAEIRHYPSYLVTDKQVLLQLKISLSMPS